MARPKNHDEENNDTNYGRNPEGRQNPQPRPVDDIAQSEDDERHTEKSGNGDTAGGGRRGRRIVVILHNLSPLV